MLAGIFTGFHADVVACCSDLWIDIADTGWSKILGSLVWVDMNTGQDVVLGSLAAGTPTGWGVLY